MLKKTPLLTKNYSTKVRWQKIPPTTGRKTPWSTKKIVKKTREAKRWPARRTPTGWRGFTKNFSLKKEAKKKFPSRRTTVGVKKKEIGGGWVCGSMRSTKICGVLKKNIIVDDGFFL